jgi:hypothetical protein
MADTVYNACTAYHVVLRTECCAGMADTAIFSVLRHIKLEMQYAWLILQYFQCYAILSWKCNMHG